ncbi:type VI secretion system tip protein VgrG, partial [Halomonas sp. ND22Bw]
VGPSIKVNAGGSPGSGTGQGAQAPLLPEEANAEHHERVEASRREATLATTLVPPNVCEECWKKALAEGQSLISGDGA